MITAHRLNRLGFPQIGLARDVDRMVGALLGDAAVVRGGAEAFRTPVPRGFPAVNAWEDERAIVVESELPGFRLEDLDISLLGNELRISGSRPEPKRESGDYHRRERFTGQFSRTFTLGVDVDPEKVEARLERGVLTVTLPKVAAAKPRKIEITKA